LVREIEAPKQGRERTMKITDISLQTKNPDRVNISIDGKYALSLSLYQITDLKLKIGSEITADSLAAIEAESQFGKLYSRALEYSLMRPHSVKEVKDYLWRKTRTTKYKSRDGQIKERPGVDQSTADRVLERLISKKYVDDVRFAKYWIENRNQTKGSSMRKLIAELRAKGVSSETIDEAVAGSERSDEEELSKIINKKKRKYDDEQKLIAYLARQGFSFDAIKKALSSNG
jgi:regulatory protein